MILDRILRRKQDEVDRLRPRRESLERAAAEAPPARGFAAALGGAGTAGEGTVAVIAEFKRRSPSAGEIADGAEPAAVAAAYEAGGAAALSVLTDGPDFGGSLEDLGRARGAVGLPVLRKDFLIDPLQVLESRGAGADAVLLIVRALPEGRLEAMLDACRAHGMDALVEVHDGDELERGLDAGARVIGVNARDLESFDVDVSAALEVVARVPGDRLAVAESGIRGREDVGVAGRAGADAVLVGGWLMERDPAAGVRELCGRHRRPRQGAAARSGGG